MKITNGIYSVGVQNPSLRVFDIIMRTDYGTTYNAYIVRGSEKSALIETAHDGFFSDFLDNVRDICPLSDIDYVILNHTEPDHSGSLKMLLEENPDITVVASPAGIKNLKSITNAEFKSETAKDGDAIDLGDISLKFLIAPMLHWPDSMFTYAEEKKTLFPCDFLGAHFCEPTMLDTHIKDERIYDKEFLNYYTAIFSPFKTAVLKGLDKIKDLEIEYVCPSHGPVLTSKRINKNMELYRKWSTDVPHDVLRLPIFYVSAYGCTERMALEAQSVLKQSGVECPIYNVIENDMAHMAEELDNSDGFMLGSPTINRDALKPIWDLISSVDAVNCRGKAVGVFGSYGWSGEAVPMLIHRLNDIGFSVVGDGVRACFVPNTSELEEVKKYTEDFIGAVKDGTKARQGI